MSEEIDDEQKRVFAYGHVRRHVLDESDRLIKFEKGDEYAILSTSQMTSIFIQDHDGDASLGYVLQFQKPYHDEALYQVYPRSKTKTDLYNMVLSKIGKTVCDVQLNPFQETYVVFKKRIGIRV